MSSTGIWNLEDLRPSNLCFIVCSSFEHSCCNSRTMTYLITNFEVLFCTYLSQVCTYFTTLLSVFHNLAISMIISKAKMDDLQNEFHGEVDPAGTDFSQEGVTDICKRA